jgi:phage antirepressor YoqD-like protein
MAKSFGKEVKNYLRLTATNELISAYVRNNHVSPNQLVIVNQGSPEYGGGTWMHEDIALDFAQWLSVDFKIWCNGKIKELLNHGITATQPTLDNIINNPEFGIKLLTELKVEREQKALLQTKIEQDKPKVVFADSVSGSVNSILVRQFAKDLSDDEFKTGEKRLFEWFRHNKYLNKKNEPYQQYIEMGLFEVITRSVGSGAGTFTTKTPKVTGKGQIYFASKIKLGRLSNTDNSNLFN